MVWGRRGWTTKYTSRRDWERHWSTPRLAKESQKVYFSFDSESFQSLKGSGVSISRHLGQVWVRTTEPWPWLLTVVTYVTTSVPDRPSFTRSISTPTVPTTTTKTATTVEKNRRDDRVWGHNPDFLKKNGFDGESCLQEQNLRMTLQKWDSLKRQETDH